MAAAGEFGLIARYFTRPTPSALLGPGDDCALLLPTPGKVLAVTTDMLVAGVHFLPDTDPQRLGWKTLAVNLSDLAAMGATARWVT
uniref:AIR synthase related protein n=1 Tax=Azonexus sp. TaxID=1872668 RepID=UPI0039E498BA